MSVLELDKMRGMYLVPVNKVIMYEALQYFKKRDLIRILRNILSLTDDDGVILLSSVPDSNRK